jgi:hypothetical protein
MIRTVNRSSSGGGMFRMTASRSPSVSAVAAADYHRADSNQGAAVPNVFEPIRRLWPAHRLPGVRAAAAEGRS